MKEPVGERSSWRGEGKLKERRLNLVVLCRVLHLLNKEKYIHNFLWVDSERQQLSEGI